MKPSPRLTAFYLLFGTCVALPARAEDSGAPTQASLGMDPQVPQAAALPGGMVPSYGRPADDQELRFDYHGFLTAPLRIGINTRDNPRPGQSSTVLHSPPVVPDDLETFSHTGVVPTPYVQLNLTYGNKLVTGNVSIVAKVPNASSGFFDPTAQLGVNDLFLSLHLPDIGKNMLFNVNVGAFSNRYGVMGEYDEGRYGTPLIARVNGVGENIAAAFAFGEATLLVEQGIQGQSNQAGSSITPDGWNGFADPNVGSSFADHVHVGVGYKGMATLGAHYLTAWSQDERATGVGGPDGSIHILAADLRLDLARFGHLYTAFAKTTAKSSRSVGRIVEVLNTKGGPGLIDNYLGPLSGGTGKLTTFGGQYDLSVGRLVSYPVPFSGDGPDIFVSLFSIFTHVQSDDKSRDPATGRKRYDGVSKLKYGVEGAYSILPWLAVSGRYDRVLPVVSEGHRSFAVISPRVIFRTGWQAHDQVVLQYSHWLDGSLTAVRTGYPPVEDPTAIPDTDMVSLAASMWW
jgi:hypothetical protein